MAFLCNYLQKSWTESHEEFRVNSIDLFLRFRSHGWRMRSTRDRTLQAIVSQVWRFPVTIIQDEEDEVMWKHGQDDFRDSFSSNKTWSLIRDPRENVAWYCVNWFPQGVPRFAIFAWLAIKDRLSTGARIRNWGLMQPCLFCGEPVETRDHLYFACPYTYTVWIEVVGNLFGDAPDPDWETTLERITARETGRLSAILLRLAFQVAIYYIWIKRNNRRHNHISKPASQLCREIDKTKRNRILSTKYYESPKLYGLMQCWFSTRGAIIV
ncbi:uncharacterized protein LOC106350738 [Brassica napus]|nr:uncharacterized protein LOC106350738 [Brassica napus]